MPPRDLSFGTHTLVVPAYLSTGPDDPGLAAWTADHPDWFEAGTWTAAPRSDASERHQRMLDATRATVGKGKERPSIDAATISLADFHAVTAQAKADRLDLLGSNVVPAQQPSTSSELSDTRKLATQSNVRSTLRTSSSMRP